MSAASTPDRPTRNLLPGPQPVRLADEPETSARTALTAGEDVRDVARRYPSSSLVWAVLAEESGVDEPVASYAYARTGYHRGLDALRRAGWRGQGPIPVDHEPNQGFLRALLALSEAADAIGEEDEAARCAQFLADSGVAPDDVRALR